MTTMTLTGTIGSLLLVIPSMLGTHAAERLVPSQYATIQAAVNAAANGDTIRIAAGEYREQANVLNKRLAIIGDTGAVLHAHAEMETVPWPNNNNVAIFGFERADVVVSNLVLEGNQQGDFYAGLFCGIIFRSSSGRLENCTIRGFRDSSGSQDRAVNVNNGLNNGIINVSVVGCSFSDNFLSLVLFGNDSEPAALRTRFNVQSNTFTGLGADAPFFHAGIWIAVGAEGSLVGNTIVDHVYNVPDNNAVGIAANDGTPDTRGFASLRPVVYSGNVLSNNSFHLHILAANGSKITNNVFEALAKNSTAPALGISGTNVVIADNNFENIPEAIRLFGQGDTALNVPSGTARNIKITANWFTNVTTPIRAGEAVTFDEIGTELCCFTPRFQTMELYKTGNVHARVRNWHGEPVVVESSTDLKQWTPLQTRPTVLPLSEFNYLSGNGGNYRFYRLRVGFDGSNDNDDLVPDFLISQLRQDGSVLVSIALNLPGESTREDIARVYETVRGKLLAQGFISGADPFADIGLFGEVPQSPGFYITVNNQWVLSSLARMPEVSAIGGMVRGGCCD